MAKSGNTSNNTLTHNDEHCGLVEHRIACESCGYPTAEALFETLDDYLGFKDELPEWPCYEEALGG
jgi:hypothetical protein